MGWPRSRWSIRSPHRRRASSPGWARSASCRASHRCSVERRERLRDWLPSRRRPELAARSAHAARRAASVACYGFVGSLKNRLRLDDSLDVFGIHGIGGIVGRSEPHLSLCRRSAATAATDYAFALAARAAVRGGAGRHRLVGRRIRSCFAVVRQWSGSGTTRMPSARGWTSATMASAHIIFRL